MANSHDEYVFKVQVKDFENLGVFEGEFRAWNFISFYFIFLILSSFPQYILLMLTKTLLINSKWK